MGKGGVTIAGSMVRPFGRKLSMAAGGGSRRMANFFGGRNGFASLGGCSMACGRPFFESNFLLIGSRGECYFVGGGNRRREFKFCIGVCPFGGKFTAYFACRRISGLGGPCCACVATSGDPVAFSCGSGMFSGRSIRFLSSMGSRNINVTVVGRGMCLFSGGTHGLRPIFTGRTRAGLGERITMSKRLGRCLVSVGSSVVVQNGKDGARFIEFGFSGFLEPAGVCCTSEAGRCGLGAVGARGCGSSFSPFGLGRGCKLGCGNRAILPRRFGRINFYLGSFTIIHAGSG